MEITLIKDVFFSPKDPARITMSFKSLDRCDLLLKLNQENPVYDRTQATSFNFFQVQCPCVAVKEGSTFVYQPSLKETSGPLHPCSVSLVLHISERFR